MRRSPREVVVAYVNPTAADESSQRSLLRQAPSRTPYCRLYTSVTPVA